MEHLRIVARLAGDRCSITSDSEAYPRRAPIMTVFEFFALFGMPFVVLALGYGVYRATTHEPR